MTYWGGPALMFGPPAIGAIATLVARRRDQRIGLLLLLPALWATPLWGTMVVTQGGSARAFYAAAMCVLLVGFILQISLTIFVGHKSKVLWLAACILVANLPATAMALLGLGYGVSGAGM